MAIRKLHTYDKKKGRKVLVGFYDLSSHIFYKNVSPNHYMIKEKGYGLQEDIIQTLKELDCKKIIIITKTKSYDFAFETILNRPLKNYGHGKQRFLRVK